jgi:flagellar hook-basal body complex protein FliE
MTNINQLSSLINNVSQETIKTTNKANGADFLSLLKDLRDKNVNNKDASVQVPNFSGDILSTQKKFIGSTEDFLTNIRVNDKKDNTAYKAIDIVNNAQLRADKSSSEFAAGYGDELQVALDVSKAEQYLQFFSEVRVKFVNAIKELSRTQI